MDGRNRRLQVVGRVVLAGLVSLVAAAVAARQPSGGAVWLPGDVFVGVHGGQYRAWRPTETGGHLEVDELSPIEIPNTSGFTTGCAVDWVTGRLYTTDFESIVSEVGPTGAVLRQLSTIRVPGRGDPEMSPGNWISWAPESIVFSGDLASRRFYVGHVEGLLESAPYVSDVRQAYDWVPIATDGLARRRLWPQLLPNPFIPSNPDGTPRRTVVTRTPTTAPVPGETDWYFLLDFSAESPSGRFVSTEVTEPGDNYTPVRIDGSGFWEAPRGGRYERILDANGVPIPARRVWGKQLHAYDAAATTWETTARYFETAYGAQGTDWIDLAADQRTIYYTSESNVIFRYDLGGPGEAPRQLTPFVEIRGDSEPRLFALRLLPPGDGSGGLLVAGGTQIFRLDASGRVVQGYDAPVSHPDLPAGHGEDAFFSLSLSPDAKTLWAASQRLDGQDWVYQFDIPTGRLLRAFRAGGSVGGLCVMLEYTAARETCDGVDNDGDGVVDNNCPPVAIDDTYTTTAGTTLRVSDPATGVLANDRDPDGDPLTAVLVDAPVHGTLTLNADGTFVYDPDPGFAGSDRFTYQANEGVSLSRIATVTLVVTGGPTNRPPTCDSAVAEPATIWPPDHRFVPIDIRGVSDPDNDPVQLRITGIRQDEPVDSEGDGRHVPDGRIVTGSDGTSRAEVRAERVGTPKRRGDGRVYHISFSPSDGRGGTCEGVVRVCVPHDRGGRPRCRDGGPLYDSTTGSAPGARKTGKK